MTWCVMYMLVIASLSAMVLTRRKWQQNLQLSFSSTGTNAQQMVSTKLLPTSHKRVAAVDLHKYSWPFEHLRRHHTYVRAVEERSLIDRARNAAIAQTATEAAKAVSSAVSMKKLEAPDLDSSFIKVDDDDARKGQVDESGLPLVYDKALIEKFWENEKGALQKRWTEFLGFSIPYITKLAGYLITGGTDELAKHDVELAREARIIMEKLGPTYIKLGQTLSVRPDVLPQAALEQLAILQDNVKRFPTKIAYEVIEKELGVPFEAIFDEISEEPVAAASLAQVYRARLRESGEYVAIKVQRPDIREMVSKDLYVLRRAAEVYQGLVERFAPQQKTDYVALLNEWAVGFYTELDFMNEAKNQMELKSALEERGSGGVYIPRVYEEYSSQKLLVSEWIDGVKLSRCEPSEIRELIDIGQEVFLTQLLQLGFFHGDPHPGNLLKITSSGDGEEEGGDNKGNAKLALLDFGLMAKIKDTDIDMMVSSIIHCANKDYASLVDDFIGLRILPPDCDRSKVVPLMDKALSPYVKGGGAKKYEEELKKMYGMDGSTEATVGGFQAMTQDFLTVLNDIPFAIPPYFAILGRAIVTLEGVALTGNPDYGIIMESYPFVARKLLREDRPEIQKSLQQVLYGTNDGTLGAERLAVLLNSAMGVVARESGSAFVDLDTIPKDAVSMDIALKFFLSEKSLGLRNLLVDEAVNVADILVRQGVRKAVNTLSVSIQRPLPFIPFLPQLPSFDEVPLPVLLPTLNLAAATPGGGGGGGGDIGSMGSNSFQENQEQKQTSSSSSSEYILGNNENNNNINKNGGEIADDLPPFSLTPSIVTPKELLNTVTPKLSREEEIYALSIVDLAEKTLGKEVAAIINGDTLSNPTALVRVVLSFLASTDVKTAIRSISPDILGTTVLTSSSMSSTSGNSDEERSSFGTLSDMEKILDDLTDKERNALSEFGRKVVIGVWERFSERSIEITTSPTTA